LFEDHRRRKPLTRGSRFVHANTGALSAAAQVGDAAVEPGLECDELAAVGR
jgi:hypothetical protein